MKRIFAFLLAAVMISSLLVVPAALADGEDCYEITATDLSSPGGSNDLSSIALERDRGIDYVRFVASGIDPYVWFSPNKAPGVDRPWMLMLYRTPATDIANMGIRNGTVHGQYFVYPQNDGGWHLEVGDMSTITGDYAWDGQIYRIDVMNFAVAPEGSYIDIAYLKFFATEAEARAAAVMPPAKDYVDDYKANGTYPTEAGKVFAGWYEDAEFTTPFMGTTGEAYMKFVDKKVHTVMWQAKNGTTMESESTDVRFVTTIDSLDFRNTGFNITFNGSTVSPNTRKAFRRLKAAGSEVTPKLFSEESEYFVTFTITNVPAAAMFEEFGVEAYWTTLDGTVVTGDRITFKVFDLDKMTTHTITPDTQFPVTLLSDEMTDWVVNYEPCMLDEICDWSEKIAPEAPTFMWETEAGALYTHLFISTSSDMSDPVIYLTDKNTLAVEELFMGTTYYWQTRTEYDDKVVVSPVYSFTTLYAPRTVALEGGSNVRDIGGYYSKDGNYRVKQGLVYRGADFAHITQNGIDKAVNILGIATELDLRGVDTSGVSPLGASVNYISVSAPWYDGIFSDTERIPYFDDEIRVFADSANLPLYFHCSLGRDRTGTLALFLLAICDVSEEDIIMDYEASFFSSLGGYEDKTSPSYIVTNNVIGFIERLKTNTGEDNVNDAARTFVKSLGITDAEIAAIRANLMEEV
ncbi:MAG: tyrosine-protein phosphatase [Clostridia bacterium]|nr:tyrosine-protein phosphatase [Clostridia bacterium]